MKSKTKQTHKYLPINFNWTGEDEEFRSWFDWNILHIKTIISKKWNHYKSYQEQNEAHATKNCRYKQNYRFCNYIRVLTLILIPAITAHTGTKEITLGSLQTKAHQFLDQTNWKSKRKQQQQKQQHHNNNKCTRIIYSIIGDLYNLFTSLKIGF